MEDLISRQAAIDEFKKELTVGESKGNYVTICSAVGYEGAKQILERLPSVQERKERKMCDAMDFPDTVDEFMESYKIVDSEQVYTNGAELIPIFRMKQWFEHIQPIADVVPVSDCISRQAAIDAMEESKAIYHDRKVIIGKMQDIVNNLPSVQERKKGRWINVNEGNWNTISVFKCSACGEIDSRICQSDNYCPNCGASMTEGAES